MGWRSRSTEMLPGCRAVVGEVPTALAVPRLLLRVNCCAIGPSSLLPKRGTGQPSTLLFSRRLDQMAAVPSVSHVQPKLVGLWGISGQTINLQNIAGRFVCLISPRVVVCRPSHTRSCTAPSLQQPTPCHSCLGIAD